MERVIFNLSLAWVGQVLARRDQMKAVFQHEPQKYYIKYREEMAK